MRVGSVTRGSRSWPWAGAALVVMLAALLHLLACAHGPATFEAVRADSLLLTSSTADAQLPADARQEQVAAGQPSPTHDTEAHRCSLDGPTAQPPRACGHPAAEPTLDAPSDLPCADHTVTAPSDTGSAQPPLSAGHVRALLGVWRT
ncbi:hypothetical protein ACFWXK_21970 [Streptomyces sp. NPDC059070]